MSEKEKLEKIGEIQVGETTVQVAKNGKFRIVVSDGVDAYETPIYRVANIGAAAWTNEATVDALVQVVGRLLTERQGRNDSRRASLEES